MPTSPISVMPTVHQKHALSARWVALTNTCKCRVNLSAIGTIQIRGVNIFVYALWLLHANWSPFVGTHWPGGTDVALYLNRRQWPFTALNSWTGSRYAAFNSRTELHLN